MARPSNSVSFIETGVEEIEKKLADCRMPRAVEILQEARELRTTSRRWVNTPPTEEEYKTASRALFRLFREALEL